MKSLVEWNSLLAIDHDEIDGEHQAMIDLLNQLHEAVEAEKQTRVSNLLEQFSCVAMQHFATEERLMREIAYPHLERHKAQHDEFAERAQSLHEQILLGRIVLDEKLTEVIREWMLDHFQGEDRELGQYLFQQRD